MHPPPAFGGVKNFREVFAGWAEKILFWWGGSNFVWGSCNFEGKIKTCIIPVEGVVLE